MERFIETIFKKWVHHSTFPTSREELAYEVFPKFVLELIHRYLRVESLGEEHIPREGPAIIIANHSGYMAFDALMLSYQIYLKTGRTAKIVAHKLWFFRPEIAVPAERMGLVPATFDSAKKILENGDLLLLFPEGEEGNFKPSAKRYHLQRFRKGFLRLAYSVGCPIVPSVVLGAEETHINLSQVRFAERLSGIVLPVPLNVIPLPAKWRLKFFEGFPIERNVDKDVETIRRESRKYRRWLQHNLAEEVRARTTVFV